MSITSGFFNSDGGDRRYFASQMSRIFDGLIIDGVFATIGTAFNPVVDSGFTVNIGTGKAWFDHTWTENDAVFPVTMPDPEQVLDRIDAIVLDINNLQAVRNNSIIVVKGIPSSEPQPPVMIKELDHHQYPICYIRRTARSSKIIQADITNKIGSPETPFVLGILKTIDLDTLLGQWQSQLDEFVKSEEKDVAIWLAGFKADLQKEKELLDQWTASQQADFDAWFANVKGQLGSDPAGKLQNQINTINDATVIAHNLSINHTQWAEYAASDDVEIRLFKAGFTKRYALPVAHTTKDMIPYPTLDISSVESAGISIVNQMQCYDGGVYFYADSMPASDILVLSIECEKAVK